MQKAKRTAIILISYPKDSKAFLEIVSLISKFEALLLGSVNVFNQSKKNLIFGVLVEASTDQLGAITGSLGKISGVKVKSAVLPEDENKSKNRI
jgi:hypothetical protein